ncbi:MAG: plasmid stabilization protein [Candidatus Omnitrophota bacterium]
MNELVLRDLNGLLLERLHQNAALHGVSVEEEAKKILAAAVSATAQNSLLDRARAIRERNAHLQKTNTLVLLRQDRDK